MAMKRIVKDLQLLEKNKQDLNNSGIFWHADENDLHNISLLIIPNHKCDIDDQELKSPYTGGFFLFKLQIPEDFPIHPPHIEFYPKQNMCRLHPNYYENGKVCLSIINTWSTPDWTPSTSIMALANILEERLNERSVCFEPSRTMETPENIKKFNECVEYAVFKVAVLDVLLQKYADYKIFKTQIQTYWIANKQKYIERLQRLSQNVPLQTVRQPVYWHAFIMDYPVLLAKLSSITPS